MLKFNTCLLTCLCSKSNYSKFEQVELSKTDCMNKINSLNIIR